MQKTRYRGPHVITGPSPNVWADMPDRLVIDPAEGIYLFEDFLSFPATAHDAVGNGWSYPGVNNVTTAMRTDQIGGVVRIGATGADLDEAYLVYNNIGGMFKFISGQDLWFEARVKPSTVAAETSLMIGMVNEALVHITAMADNTGILLVTNDFVGFHSVCATPTVLRAAHVYAALGDVTNGTTTIAGTTWYKLGFSFVRGKLRFYVDNVQVGADITVTSAPLPATFPYGEELCPVIGVKCGDAVARSVDIDWVRAAMTRL